jgi:uncharacterized peroxidase-related enzyme
MAFIETISDERASGPVAATFDAERESFGYVPAYSRLFGHRPAVYAAWRQLAATIKGEMDVRRYELVTLAAARELRSSYCSLAHGKILAEQFLDAGTVRDIAAGDAAGALDAADAAVMDLAGKVVEDATSVEQADVDRLRELGLSDDEILDVVLAAALRCFFSKTLDALGVRPDPAYAALDAPLRDALTVGRPIATG